MKWTLLLLSFSFAASVRSQSDTLGLLPVEVKAIRASDKAPFAKTNLSKVDIDKQNLGQDLPFMLNSTPSVVVHSDAGTGIGYTGMRIRGTDATRINVTLNGIPFNDAESQGTFFVNLPDFLSSVNSIQVQRGAGSSSNGGSSFGATINMSTNEIVKEQSLELNNSFGSFNTWKNTLKFNSGLINKRLLFDARLSRISSDGFIERASSDLKSYYFSAAYLAGRSDFRFTTFAGKEKTYQAWYGVSEEDLRRNRRANYAGTEKAGAPYDNEIDNYQQSHYQLFFNHRFTPSLVFNTGLFLVRGKGFYEQYKADEAYADYGMPDAVNGSNTTSNTDLVRQLWLDNYYYGNVFSLLYQQDKTSLTFGGTVAHYAGDHYGKVTWAEQGLTGTNRWYDTDASKSDLSIFGKWQQSLGSDFHFYGDLQWRKVAYALNGFRDNPALFTDAHYSFINPKAGVTYIKKNWNAFASFGVANKEPNRDDFEAGLKEQPLPERLHDFELGFQQKLGKAQWSTTLYYMSYKNQLVLTGRINDVGAYTRTNIDNSYRAGIELQATLEPAAWLKASGNIALSRNRVKNFIEFIDDYDAGGQRAITYNESHLSFSPSVVSGATVTLLPYKQLELAFISKYVSKQYLDNTANDSRKLDPFFTQDIRAQYSLSAKRFKNISLIAQVYNVFNTAYEPNGYTFSYYSENKLATENFYFPMAGINWMIGVNVKL